MDVWVIRIDGHGGPRGPSQLGGEAVEQRPRSTFQNQAIGPHAAQEDAVLRRIERKEIGPPHQIRSLVVL